MLQFVLSWLFEASCGAGRNVLDGTPRNEANVAKIAADLVLKVTD
jgi:hypothetical protein